MGRTKSEEQFALELRVDLVALVNDMAGTEYQHIEEVPTETWARLVGAFFRMYYDDELTNPVLLTRGIKGDLRDEVPYKYIEFGGDVDGYLQAVDEGLAHLEAQLMAALTARGELLA